MVENENVQLGMVMAVKRRWQSVRPFCGPLLETASSKSIEASQGKKATDHLFSSLPLPIDTAKKYLERRDARKSRAFSPPAMSCEKFQIGISKEVRFSRCHFYNITPPQKKRKKRTKKREIERESIFQKTAMYAVDICYFIDRETSYVS